MENIDKTKDQLIEESLKMRHQIVTILENIHDVVFQLSPLGFIQYVSPKVEEFYGYRPEDIIGKHIIKITPKSEVIKILNAIRVVLSGKAVKNFEIQQIDSKGKNISMEADFTPLEKDGRILILHRAKKEIAELKMAEDTLREKVRELEKINKELEESQNSMIITEKLSFASRMVDNVAHEVKNPLAIISMAVQQLNKELPKGNPSKDYTMIITENIDRLDKVITEFVNLAKPVRMKMQKNNISMILEDVCRLIQPECKRHKAEVIKQLDANLPKIKVDREYLVEAFTNLLLNSCNSLPKKNGKIWITSEKDRNYIVIKFGNTGRPIPKEDLTRIFEPFFSSKKTKADLRLRISYSVISSHKGTISVESNKDTGTVFIVRLPL